VRVTFLRHGRLWPAGPFGLAGGHNLPPATATPDGIVAAEARTDMPLSGFELDEVTNETLVDP